MNNTNNNPNGSELLEKALRDAGFDGLYEPSECACLIGDLAPCEGNPLKCIAGYRHNYDPECDKCSDCEIGDCGRDKNSWCICNVKEKST